MIYQIIKSRLTALIICFSISLAASAYTQMYTYQYIQVFDKTTAEFTPISSDGNIMGIIVLTDESGELEFALTIGEKLTYAVKINNIEINPVDESGSEMHRYEGTMMFQGHLVNIDITFHYDYNIRNDVPEMIIVDVDGADTNMMFSDLEILNQ